MEPALDRISGDAVSPSRARFEPPSEMSEGAAVTSSEDREESDDASQRDLLPEGVEVFAINGPFFFGVAQTLLEAFKRVGAFPEEAGLIPTAWVFQPDRGLTIMAQDGPDAVFGDSSNYEFKVEAFEQVLRQLSEREATGSPQVAEVDLRFGRNVVLR